jgi:hypothetical protein
MTLVSPTVSSSVDEDGEAAVEKAELEAAVGGGDGGQRRGGLPEISRTLALSRRAAKLTPNLYSSLRLTLRIMASIATYLGFTSTCSKS